MEFAGSADVGRRRQRLDLLDGYVRGKPCRDSTAIEQMCCCPFDERVRVVGDRGRRWIAHMLEDRVEHRSRVLGQIEHELTEFAVEVAEETAASFRSAP